MAAALPQRTCVGCGQTDTDPRHVIDVGGGNSVNWHFDCHARSTAGCGECQDAFERAGEVTGSKLRKFLTNQ